MKQKKVALRNHVAHHMETFNKPKTFRDRTKYTRKGKQRFPFSLPSAKLGIL